MSQVQTMPGCQPGTLRPKPSGQEILFPYLHVQIKPLPGTWANSNLSQQFLQECKQKGRKCNRTESWLGFTALAGSCLCFSVYLHNSSAYYSPSRSRSEFSCLLSHSWIIVGSVTLCWLLQIILRQKCHLQTQPGTQSWELQFRSRSHWISLFPGFITVQWTNLKSADGASITIFLYYC